MTAMILEAGVFLGQSIAVSSVGTTNLAIYRADIPGSLAKAITAAAWNHSPTPGLGRSSRLSSAQHQIHYRCRYPVPPWRCSGVARGRDVYRTKIR
jgi:hypothetical protein